MKIIKIRDSRLYLILIKRNTIESTLFVCVLASVFILSCYFYFVGADRFNKFPPVTEKGSIESE